MLREEEVVVAVVIRMMQALPGPEAEEMSILLDRTVKTVGTGILIMLLVQAGWEEARR